ncbi:MAG: DUF86 domain-containing protein [Verrucomicrobiae bacterium]|nr:DUF86 domain-containing protein [Verrucomicrobiae bacterium]
MSCGKARCCRNSRSSAKRLRLPKAFTERHAGIPWPDIVAFRNIAVHEYFAVDWRILWVTATQEVPLLRSQIARLLEEMGHEP